MKKLKNRVGLILTEAIISVAILAIGGVILTTIISNAISTIQASQDYVIAQNLASESIEAMKSIRDTNWLLKPDSPECWLTKNPTLNRSSSTGGCSSNPQANLNETYRPIQANSSWQLETASASITNTLDLSAGDIANRETPYRLYISTTSGINRYINAGSGATPSRFYRGIHFLSIDGTSAAFEVRVQWRAGLKVRKIARKFTLYNYL